MPPRAKPQSRGGGRGGGGLLSPPPPFRPPPSPAETSLPGRLGWEAAHRDLGPCQLSLPLPSPGLPLAALSKETKGGGEALKGTGRKGRGPAEGPAGVYAGTRGLPRWPLGILGRSPCTRGGGGGSAEPGGVRLQGGSPTQCAGRHPLHQPSIRLAGSPGPRATSKGSPHPVPRPCPSQPSQAWPPADTPERRLGRRSTAGSACPPPAHHTGPRRPHVPAADWTVRSRIPPAPTFML